MAFLDDAGLAYFWGKVKAYVAQAVDSGGTGCPFPVGAVLHMVNAVDPNDIYPGTAWTAINGVFLYASSSDHALGATGGAETVTLTAAQSGLPAHTHGFTQPKIPNHSHGMGNVWSSGSGSNNAYTMTGNRARTTINTATDGGGGACTGGAVGAVTGGAKDASAAHENMPPYKVVNMWQRIA